MITNNPFFSVIVPAHNSEHYIQRGLQSIIEQSFNDYELIVVCDACTDNTKLWAHWYADDIGGKVLVTDFGMDGLARNAGIDVARGKWIIFMDDDDWFLHEYAFQLLYDEAINTDADMLIFDFIWKGRGYYRNDKGRTNIAVWSKCWRRSFVGDTRFPAIPFTSDDPFMQAIIAKRPWAVWMRVPLYYYNYMRKGSQTEEHTRPDGAGPEARDER